MSTRTFLIDPFLNWATKFNGVDITINYLKKIFDFEYMDTNLSNLFFLTRVSLIHFYRQNSSSGNRKFTKWYLITLRKFKVCASWKCLEMPLTSSNSTENLEFRGVLIYSKYATGWKYWLFFILSNFCSAFAGSRKNENKKMTKTSHSRSCVIRDKICDCDIWKKTK